LSRDESLKITNCHVRKNIKNRIK